MKARSVEAGEPHVAHKHDPEGIRGIAKALCQRLGPRLVRGEFQILAIIPYLTLAA